MKRSLRIFVLALGCATILAAGCTDTTTYPQDLIVISTTPGNGQTNVSQNALIQLRFSESVDHQTVIGTGQVILVDQSNAPIPVSFTFQGEVVTVTPASPLGPNATYGVAVRPGVRDMYGNNIVTPFAGTFSTGQVLGTIPNWPPFQIPNPPPVVTQTPGTFSQTAPMVWARTRHTMTTLIGGKILVVGGENDIPRGRVLRSAEWFDPATLQWTPSMSLGPGINGMNFERYGHTSTLLKDGRVLVAGGTNNLTTFNTAELYDPVNDVFAKVQNQMVDNRKFHTAHLLENGNVLLVCGLDNNPIPNFLDTLEVYDVNSGTFNQTSVNLLTWVLVMGGLQQPTQQSMGRCYHISEVLPDRSVLIAGGYTFPWALQALSTDDSQLFTPDTTGIGAKGTIRRSATAMTVPRVAHTSNIYPSAETAGLVVIFGGFENSPFQGILKSGEVFDYQELATTGLNAGQAGVFTPLAQQMSITRWGHTSTVVSDGFTKGGILVVGGAQHTPPQDWTNALPNPRAYPWLEAAGCIGCTATAASDIFMPFGFGKSPQEPFRGINITGSMALTQDINGNTTSPGAVYTQGVFFHAAEGLANGGVLLTGGAGCPFCFPAPFQWGIYSQVSINGINYQGASVMYNP